VKAITEAEAKKERVARAATEMAQEDGLASALNILELAEAGVSPLRPA